MGITDLIAGIFKPAADLIDKLHTSTEEKMAIQKEMQQAQLLFQEKLLDYESKLLTSQAAIITSESTSPSWAARNWRPITMLTFLALVVLDSFNILKNPLSDQAWLLLQIGMGGYVVGRSGEKIIGQLGDIKKT